MRRRAAAEIGRVRDAVADSVTDSFLTHHPDWIERYGEGAEARGVRDARHHIDLLQEAVASDAPTVLRDYALARRDLLAPRGIGVEFLIESLEKVRDEMVALLSPAGIEAVDVATRISIEALAAEQSADPCAGGSASPACRLFLAAAISGRRKEALGIVREALSKGRSPADVYVDIFQNALHEVGRRWQTSGLTIAEEHMATATTQFILSVLHEELPRPASRPGTAVVTGVRHERHVVGANIVANVLDEAGWDVHFLGTDLPHEAIVSVIDQHRANLVAISVTMSERVADARDLIDQIRRGSEHAPRILVGGAAFLQDDGLWRAVGADGFAADVRDLTDLDGISTSPGGSLRVRAPSV